MQTVVSLPRDASIASNILGGHAALRRRATVHSADFAVVTAYFRYAR